MDPGFVTGSCAAWDWLWDQEGPGVARSVGARLEGGVVTVLL